MPKKEIRFQELVKVSGKPDIVSLWTDPTENRSFMKAVKENRVLTIRQEPASKKKDFGQIGFHQEPHAAYLVFPESLPENKTSRVIGIKYDLIESGEVTDPVKAKDLKPAPRKKKLRPPARTFNAVIRRTAVIETSVTVSAGNENQARRAALELAHRERFDFSKAVIRDEIKSIE